MTNEINSDAELLRHKLNLESGKLTWPELERHYARGIVIVITAELELVEVAASFAEDKKDNVEKWMNTGQIHRANDDDAKHWNDSDPVFWSIVVAPWVLAQEIVLQ
jgi:hypothetical protein